MSELEEPLRWIHPATLAGALTYAGLLAAIGFAGSLAIRSFAKAMLKHDPADRTAVLFLRPLAQVVLWMVLLVAYAHIIPGLRSIGTALLAGASVISIVLGVAAQSTLGNLISGIALLIYRPFRVGDRLQVVAPTGVEMGTVESVSLGYTVLQTMDNRRVVLPNSQASSQTTINLTSVDARIMAIVPVGIAYTADVARAREILLDIAKEHAEVLEIVGCPVTELTNSSIVLSMRAWCHDPVAARQFEWHLYEKAKKRFDEAGIEIPYPYQNIVIKERSAPGLVGR